MDSIRDAGKIKGILKEVGTKVITTEGCRIVFPVRYEMVGLARVGSEYCSVYGFFAIYTKNKEYYSVMNVCTMVPTLPDEINTIEVDGKPYYEFIYDAGSTVVTDIDVYVDDKIVGKIFKEFINQGKLPYYCTYMDATCLFDTAKSFANANLGSEEALGIPISIIARNPDNPSQYYREIMEEVDYKVVKPLFVPSSSVTMSATSTLAKLAGSYFHEGIVSSLNNPTEQTELLDYIVRY